MAQADEVLGQLASAAAVVEGQGDRSGVRRRRPSAQHHARPGVRQLPQLRRHRRRVRRVLDRAAGQHDRRGPLPLEQGQVGQLALGRTPCVADHGQSLTARPPARPSDLRLDRARHDPEEGVGDVVDQDADQVGRGRGQRARRTVQHVVQLVHRPQHPLPGGGGDGVVPVQHARHRRGGDLGAGRHVRQGHRHLVVLRSRISSYHLVLLADRSAYCSPAVCPTSQTVAYHSQTARVPLAGRPASS